MNTRLCRIVFLLRSLTLVVGQLDACQQTFGSNKYDLNQLNTFTLSGDDGSFRYVLVPCGLVTEQKCGRSTMPFEKGMTACQERISSSTFESAMGFLNGYGKSPDLEFLENPSGSGTGVIMTMRNALCNGQQRLVKVVFICDETILKPTTMHVVESPTCSFTITVRAAGACPVKADKNSKSSFSGGAIFLIILLVFAFVYFVAGITYNRLKDHKSGLELIPHRSVWSSIFVCFFHGVRYTFDRITFGKFNIRSSSGKYQSV